MKTILIAFVFIFLTAGAALSQVITFGVGADVTFPTADFQNLVSTGYGATALAKFGILPIVDLTGGVEYLSFSGKSITVDNQTGDATSSAIGVVLGGRVNFLVMCYAGLEGGTYSFTTKFPGMEDNKITYGFYSPMVGVKLAAFDLAARYVVAGESKFWGLRGMIWF